MFFDSSLYVISNTNIVSFIFYALQYINKVFCGHGLPVHKESGRPGSNRRHPPWKGGALPTELLPPTHSLRSLLRRASPQKHSKHQNQFSEATQGVGEWAREDLNLHRLPRQILSLVRLPVPPLARVKPRPAGFSRRFDFVKSRDPVDSIII